jgi:small-conductance mechanosensitive channel
MATAEYAIATIAAVGFAGLLITVLKSDTVKGLLSGIIKSALSIG